MPRMQHESFKDWANLQQNELNERKGDGYSWKEYLIDSLAGAPTIMRRKLNAMDSNTWAGQGYDSREPDDEGNKMLNAMRVIADKQKNPNYSLTFPEATVQRSWKVMLDDGKVDVLPKDVYDKIKP